jgi:hypothetical protein
MRERLSLLIFFSGFAITLVGYWGPWVNHKTAALVLSGLEMAEFVKFLPDVREGKEPMVRELFYLPLLGVALCLSLFSPSRPRWARLTMLTMAFLLVIIVLPPYPFILRALTSAEFRWQFISAVSCLLLVAVIHFLPRIFRALLMSTISLACAFLPLWQFFSIRDALDRTYGRPIQIGWGLWLTAIGILTFTLASIVELHAKKKASVNLPRQGGKS